MAGDREEGKGLSNAEGKPAPDPSTGIFEMPGEPEEESSQVELGGAVSFRAAEERGAGSSGFADIVVAEDEMSATATLAPPTESDKALSMDSVRELIGKLGIVAGVDEEGLANAVLSCNLERRPIHGFLLARGKAPSPEIPEHYKLEPRFAEKRKQFSLDPVRVDPKEQSSLLVAKKGELLASLVPASAGQAGYNIRGREIPAPHSSVLAIGAGENVIATQAGLEAAVDGLISFIGDIERGPLTLKVDQVLLVRGDVDYSTGHIVFPGDVFIEGRVGDGFKVWSGGSIHCKATMDAYDVNSKKDLLCSQGIIGRRKAEIKVGGELRAKFVQNCRVAVRGNVTVSTAIVGTRLYSLGMVDLGDKGVIMGGELFASHGVRCGRLGNQAHQRTLVHVGSDFAVKQRLDRSNEKLRLLALEARKAAEIAKQNPSPAIERRRQRIDEAMVAIAALIGQLLLSLDTDDEAFVEVKGEIFPGVIIEICQLSIVIDELLRGCRFRLDKTSGRVLTERLTHAAAPAKKAT
jgi:uncharacterized protein (DUF342 family)